MSVLPGNHPADGWTSTRGPLTLPALEQLAARAERRAAHARRHAAEARDHAGRDRAHGDDESERLHLREAEAHERAALVTEQTAALYRRRVRCLTSKESRLAI